MAVRKALVVNAGQIQQLQTGDTLEGAGGATALTSSQNILTANYTVAADTSAYVTQYLEVADGFTLEVADGGYLEIG